MEYRINVDNKFAAIQADDDNEADPIEALLKLQEQLILSKKSAPQKTTSTGKKTATSTVASKNEKNVQVKSSVGGQAAKQTNTKPALAASTAAPKSLPSTKPIPNKPTGKIQRSTDNAPNVVNENRPSFDSWGPDVKIDKDEMSNRTRGGFRRGSRGGRGGHEGFDRFGKREFDRHSGSDKSGFRPQEKREGGGAHNWGSVKDDIADQLNNTNLSEQADTTRSEPTEESSSPDHPTAEAESDVKKEEEEEKQLTLDEWKKLEEEKRVKSQFNIRKPNEGCSDPKWNKMFVLKKKDDDDEEEEDDEDEGYDEKTKQKNVVPIRITFNDARRGGRGRGGRGGVGAGGVRRQDADGDRKKASREAPAPNVDDEKDFPSLS